MVQAPWPSADDAASDAIATLTGDLVRIASRGGRDPYDPIIDHLVSWLAPTGLDPQRLISPTGDLVGITCEIRGAQPGPTYVLDATIDTAPFGDLESWTHHPLSGHVADGRLHGRGSADSKVGVAIFAAVGATLASEVDRLAGRLILLFEGDEHNGTFTGARTFFDTYVGDDTIDGLMIGYPGPERLVVGARGFTRFVVTMHGEAAHSGSSRPAASNAITKASRLIERLDAWNGSLAGSTEPGFTPPPKVTVTSLRSGDGFSIVPDRCEVGIDIRLTPSFDAHTADDHLRQIVAELDEEDSERATTIEALEGWPAFRTPSDTPFVQALRRAAVHEMGAEIPLEVVGPSNIGNYAATLGIRATAGFGPAYENLHAADECVELATIAPVYRVYLNALRTLFERR